MELAVRDRDSTSEKAVGRRAAVLDSALATFARFGYRKTSMEAVAREAQISRPGLYFLFASKDELFRAAVTRALTADLDAAVGLLAETERALPDRLLDAFDRWAGRYVGPLERAVSAVIEDNPDLLGTAAVTAAAQFASAVSDAVVDAAVWPDPKRARAAAQTLISASIGIKHQVDSRPAYRRRLRTAIDVIVG